MAVAMASIFLQVEVKYCAIWSFRSSPISGARKRKGLAMRTSPMTVQKYLFRYCRRTSELKEALMVRRHWVMSSAKEILRTSFSGRSPPKKAICSQLVMSSECFPRKFPSSFLGFNKWQSHKNHQQNQQIPLHPIKPY